MKWVDYHYIKSYKNNRCSASVWLHNDLRGGLPPGAPLCPPQQLGGDQTRRPEVCLRDQAGSGGEVDGLFRE